MYTLVFLLCVNSGSCVQQAPQQVFQNVTQCEIAAETIIGGVQQQVDRGEMPPHSAAWKCIPWGHPA